MGAVEAKLFASEGAKVVVADVLEDEGKRVEAEIVEAGGEALFVRLDVTSEEDWEVRRREHGIPLRTAGHTGEQRGRQQPFGGRPGQPGELGTDYEHQLYGRVPGNETRGTEDAGSRRRIDSQHIVHHGTCGRGKRAPGIQCFQGLGAVY